MASTEAYRYGAFYVVEDAQSHQIIDAALKRLDPRLFLERQLTLDQEFVWTVQLDVGDQVPVWVFDWRDDDDRAINEPTFRIVDEVAAMVKRGPISNEDHRRRNAELAERRRRDAMDEVAELARDYAKHRRTTTIGFGDAAGKPRHSRHRAREARLRASDRLVRAA